MIGQRIVVLILTRVRPQVRESLRSAIAGPVVVVQDALSQSLVGGFLVDLPQRGVHAEAARIDVLGVMLGQGLTHHFRDVFGVQRVLSYLATRLQRRF